MDLTDESQFEQLYRLHFHGMIGFARIYVSDVSIAEEMVQNVFLNIWSRRASVELRTSIKSYLFRSVHNECLNYIKKMNVREKAHHEIASQMISYTNDASESLQAVELRAKIQKVIQALPKQCAVVFRLSRNEQLSYAEIAQTLGISIKTVENQMGKALRILRSNLQEYIPIIIMLLFDHLHHYWGGIL
jgi:RNA polymerase sigma-70 factor (ECF subfamily)